MAEDRALTVTEAMHAARRALETVSLRVIGELSELSDKVGYKAAYFTVCDEGAAMPCMMWRDAYLASGVQLRPGVLVEIAGSFSAYVPKGRMQFMVRSLSLAGEGVLRMQVAALAKKLEAEGLMRDARKRSLPRFPERIGLVTSPRGKAVHDVVRTLRRRYPVAELVIAGVQVEGADAVEALVHGLEVIAGAGVDVILLVRGGGSYEDLMPFNSEEVARAVVASPVPVVTGIGHEPDTSIADMVADVRASTPTAAAEAAAPSRAELQAALRKERRMLASALELRLQRAEHSLRLILHHPVYRDCRVALGPVMQRLDELASSLHQAIPRRVERDAQRLDRVLEGMRRVGPRLTERTRERVAHLAARAEDLSPLKVLARGYAMCMTGDGRSVVRSISEVAPGDRLSVRIADGRIGCVVDSTEREV